MLNPMRTDVNFFVISKRTEEATANKLRNALTRVVHLPKSGRSSKLVAVPTIAHISSRRNAVISRAIGVTCTDSEFRVALL